MNEENGIQNSFDSTLKDTNLEGLAVDFTDLTIDRLVDSDVLRDVPIVATIVALGKLGANIHDRLFLKKILVFLSGLKDVSAEERNRMIKDIDESKKYRVKVGEKLLYIIDSCNDFGSSERVAVLFKALVEEKISYDDFLMSTSALVKITDHDFNWFIKERKTYNFDLNDVGDLVGSGLFELYYDQLDVHVRDQDDYKAFRREGAHVDKYITEIDGGGVSVHLSRAGEVVLEIFCLSYQKPKSIKI